MAGSPLIATDRKTTLRSSINVDGCGDRSVDGCHPDNYRNTSSELLWHSDCIKVSRIDFPFHEVQWRSDPLRARHGYNTCNGAGGISRDPDQALYAKEGRVKPEIIESRRDRADEGRHFVMPSSLQQCPKPCPTSSPCSGNDFSEHSGQNF